MPIFNPNQVQYQGEYGDPRDPSIFNVGPIVQQQPVMQPTTLQQKINNDLNNQEPWKKWFNPQTYDINKDPHYAPDMVQKLISMGMHPAYPGSAQWVTDPKPAIINAGSEDRRVEDLAAASKLSIPETQTTKEIRKEIHENLPEGYVSDPHEVKHVNGLNALPLEVQKNYYHMMTDDEKKVYHMMLDELEKQNAELQKLEESKMNNVYPNNMNQETINAQQGMVLGNGAIQVMDPAQQQQVVAEEQEPTVEEPSFFEKHGSKLKSATAGAAVAGIGYMTYKAMSSDNVESTEAASDAACALIDMF